MNKAAVMVFIAALFAVAISCPAQDNKEYTYPYDSAEFRDPMRTLVDKNGRLLIKDETVKKNGIWDLRLQGIMASPEGNSAIINSEIYSTGDTVEGYYIKQVTDFEVVVEKDGKEFSLKWEGGI